MIIGDHSCNSTDFDYVCNLAEILDRERMQDTLSAYCVLEGAKSLTAYLL